MTKEQLESYRSLKAELPELKSRLAHLGDNDEMVGHDVINDYRSGYPVPNIVTGVDWQRYYSTKDRITNRMAKISKAIYEIEEWVESIEDSLTRRIFQMYYLDGMSQDKVADAVGYSRGRVSQKISDFLKD